MHTYRVGYMYIRVCDSCLRQYVHMMGISGLYKLCVGCKVIGVDSGSRALHGLWVFIDRRAVCCVSM